MPDPTPAETAVVNLHAVDLSAMESTLADLPNETPAVNRLMVATDQFKNALTAVRLENPQA